MATYYSDCPVLISDVVIALLQPLYTTCSVQLTVCHLVECPDYEHHAHNYMCKLPSGLPAVLKISSFGFHQGLYILESDQFIGHFLLIEELGAMTSRTFACQFIVLPK